MKKLLKQEDGYFTVEVTLVFTVILFAIMLVIFIGVVLYQQVNLQSVAERTAARGAVMYSSGVVNMNTGVKDFKQCNPYRYIFEDNDYKISAEKEIKKSLENNMGFYNVYKGSNEHTEVKVEKNLISRRVVVSAGKEYKFPIVSAANTFGIKSPFAINVSATSEVTDPVEFIRNTDLCVDIIKESSSGNELMTKMSSLKDKIIEFVNKLNISDT